MRHTIIRSLILLASPLGARAAHAQASPTTRPAAMTAIREAIARRDSDAAARSAHALKGSVGLFVQRGAFDTVRQLESIAKTGDLTNADAMCATLDEHMTELDNALRGLRQQL